MGESTDIEWSDASFSPWEGCVKVSEACKNCYAEARDAWLHPTLKKDQRPNGEHAKPTHWGVNAPRRFHPDAYWEQPLKWNRKAKQTGIRPRVFCASLADVFEDRRDLDPHRERLWKLVEATPNLDWLLLTKRPENVGAMAPWREEWPSNVWLGTTVENQQRLDERLPHLVEHPAVVRFLSIEPLLGPLDMRNYLDRIQWVIVGGETGHGSRPTLIEWARQVRDQCQEFGVPFFFKQWGTYAPDESGTRLVRLRRKHDRLLDGRTWDQFPERRVAQQRTRYTGTGDRA